MTLHLHDTATRTTAPFTPVREGAVSLYVCGPTTQGAPHLGHLRTFLSFDVLVRWLERSGYEVAHVRNVTDIDDKILVKSAEAGAEWFAWSLRFEREFQDVLDRIGNRRPTYEPRATGHVPEMIELMQRLIERGHAYADGAGSVYFDVASLPTYGALTRQSLEDMQDAGEEMEPGKRDRRDFALWKAAKATEPETASWDTPFGRGRPGWHLECSAMSRKYLGETFDIHAGGLDLRFPHHENEQAQSHAAGYGFAQRWMHSGMVTVDGLKMGKSLTTSSPPPMRSASTPPRRCASPSSAATTARRSSTTPPRCGRRRRCGSGSPRPRAAPPSSSRRTRSPPPTPTCAPWSCRRSSSRRWTTTSPSPRRSR